jgi:APA family basic amino acid/polyamine antiporter
MSRDHVLPSWFRRLGRFGTPVRGIAVTLIAVLAALVLLDPIRIAKLAGAFQLLMFALLNVAVIVMRESGIASYDPGYRAPAYPWLQLAGVAGALGLVGTMGWGPTLFALALTAISIAWYYGYARPRVVRAGAIYHVFERLGRRRFTPLDAELRGILKEKGLREQDPFDTVVGRAQSLDVEDGCDYEEAVARAARVFAERLHVAADLLERGFLEGTRIGATPVEHGVAIPHTRIPDIASPELVLIRSRAGIHIDPGVALGRPPVSEPTHALFFVVSPDREASQHLRFLAHLAVQVDDPGFMPAWLATRETHALPALMLRGERSAWLQVTPSGPAAGWIDRPLRDLTIPGGCLVALVRRGEASLVPHGSTVIRAGDHLTVIGNPQDVGVFRSWAHEGEDH